MARPGQGIGENYTDSDQTVLELLNRFGADGWELAGLQDYREGGNGSSYWEAPRLLTVYTFKRPLPLYTRQTRRASQVWSKEMMP